MAGLEVLAVWAEAAKAPVAVVEEARVGARLRTVSSISSSQVANGSNIVASSASMK